MGSRIQKLSRKRLISLLGENTNFSGDIKTGRDESGYTAAITDGEPINCLAKHPDNQ